MGSDTRLHAATGRRAKTTTHPGFARRLPGGDGAAGFIAAAKRREAFKTAAEIGGAHAGGKPRKRGRRSGNSKDNDGNGEDGNDKDGGNRPEECSALKTPAIRRNPHDTRWNPPAPAEKPPIPR